MYREVVGRQKERNDLAQTKPKLGPKPKKLHIISSM